MKNTEIAFLAILKAALQNRRLSDMIDLTQEHWREIFTLAEAHKVLPMVYQTVYQTPALADTGEIRSRVRKLVMIQIRKTEDFLTLNQKLKEAGCPHSAEELWAAQPCSNSQ